MAAHARFKNEFTEDEKCHNLMSWLILLQKGNRLSEDNGCKVNTDSPDTAEINSRTDKERIWW